MGYRWNGVALILVKTEKRGAGRELRGLQSAMKELSIDSGIIVTWDDEKILEGNINVVPV